MGSATFAGLATGFFRFTFAGTGGMIAGWKVSGIDLMKATFLLLLCVFGGVPAVAKEKPSVQYTIKLPPKPDFSALGWLVGEWAGQTTNGGVQGDVRFSVNLDLDQQVMVLRGEVALPETGARPAWKETYLGILTAPQSDGGFVLQNFSSSGFITRYRVTIDGGEVRMTPAGGEQPPPGWLFRRVLDRIGVDEFTETVEAAPPGKPFFDYYTAKLERVKPAVKPPEKSAAPPPPTP